MKQEDIELLLTDLCARLPHKTYVKTTRGIGYIYAINTSQLIELSVANNSEYWSEVFNIDEIKPYLRPISSMTEEEKHDLLVTVVGNEGVEYFQVLPDGTIDNTDEATQDLNKFNIHWINFDKDTVTLYLNWLNEHYFDYHGLIEKGLAIAVTEENNPYKK